MKGVTSFSPLLLVLAATTCWCGFALVPMALASCPPQNPEISALLAFKAALSCDDPSNCVLSSWELPSLGSCLSTNISHPCSFWPGIACQSDHVVALNLSLCGLRGTISPSLAHLPFLVYLNLSHNLLTGRIPVEIANCSSLTTIGLRNNSLADGIPAELGMLSKLQVLSIGSNILKGGVPSAIANCTALTTLKLYLNQLSGPIPAELGKLSQLQTLYLWGNQLSGEIPQALGNCTSLTDLQLCENSLSGSIPSELGMLKELSVLLLYINNLTGEIPTTLGNCSALTGISFYLNSLSGIIPAEIGMLKQVKVVYLWDNQLTGHIPSAIGNCTSLTDLELVWNDLSGPIPAELGMLKEMTSLYLWSNQLTGEIPSSLQNCTSLTDLEIWDNRLSGPIPVWSWLQILWASGNRLSGNLPPALANCTAMSTLLLGSNSLSGAIPDVFHSLTSLGKLDLSGNSFSGLLPGSLAGLNKLVVLRLQNNALTGTVPESFVSSLILAYLDMSNNNLSGLIPDSFRELPGLVNLALCRNQFIGSVPPSLGSLPQLVFLDLSWNALSGGIPASFEGALELQYVNLSHNNLTGPLPASFATLKSLILLNLSYNQLEGPVPDAVPYNSTTTLVDLRGNPLLCGEALNRSCAAPSHQSILQNNKTWFIPITAAFCLLVLLLIAGIVIIRQRLSKHSPFSNDPLKFKTHTVKASLRQLHVATDGFCEDRILGQGGSSIVYRGILAEQHVAVKVLKPGQTTTKAQVDCLKREIEVLAKVRHRNIVKVLGCCFNLDVQAIILELMPNGNLDTYLHTISRPNGLSKEAKVRLLCGIARGLEYLHHWHDPGRSIVHCDLKPANILLGDDWEPRIADFGIAKLLRQAESSVQAQQDPASVLLRGSIGYIPPEYAFNAEVSTAGDVYSFGVVMLEVLTGKRPTDFGNETEGKDDTLVSLVQDAYPDKLLPLFSHHSCTTAFKLEEAQQLAHMALSCTSQNALQRPTMVQVTRFLSGMSTGG